MFSQRRSFPWGKLLFPFLIAALLGFGYWVNQGDSQGLPATSESNAAETLLPRPADKESISSTGQGGISLEQRENQAAVTESDEEEENPPPVEKSYFLLKEAGGVVSLFYCTDTGEESYIRDTEIAFALLSEGDQALFRQGVQVPSELALDEILQDFES